MPLKTQTAEEPPLNLTPMIDIVFLLIIFFMVGTQFAERERKYDVELPTVSDAVPLTSQPDEIVVNVQADGTIVVGNSELSLADLETTLKTAKQNFDDQAVLIRGDASVAYQHVMNVMSICRRIKIRFSLANRLASKEQTIH